MAPSAARGGEGPAAGPRTRGDGSHAALGCLGAVDWSPHTRGWLLGHNRVILRYALVPAHAGMARMGAKAAGIASTGPRTRGDGSFTQASSRTLPGWSPAHAGMAPAHTSARGCWTTGPRTRGDGSPFARASSYPWNWSPHTRGWLGGGRYWPVASALVPAHAGMAPRPVLVRHHPGAGPRTRGDGSAWSS